VNELIQMGMHTSIDPRYRHRSFVERRLVDVMYRMWPAQTEQRVTIFEVVQYLRQTKVLYNRQYA
jgi:hypothetical protein